VSSSKKLKFKNKIKTIKIISAPYDIENSTSESKFLSYWIHPPAENKPAEYGRPMVMNFSIQQDDTLQDGLQEEMQNCVDYYKQFKNELIAFERNFLNETSFISKMKSSLFSKFPRDQIDGNFWNWIRVLLGLAKEEVVELPKIMKQAYQQPLQQQQHSQQLQQQTLEQALKNNEMLMMGLTKEDENITSETESETNQLAQENQKFAIQCLQQQLSQPSGLNMTPSPLSSALNHPAVPSANNVGNSTSNTNTTTSPRDSPSTIPSNSASPAKFEMPFVRASPSPAKSDASSCRTRNSPAPSPGKHNILGDQITRNSPGSKPDLNYSMGAELYAATLASLAGKSQSELTANDLSALLQYTKKSDLYGLAALNALQGGGNGGGGSGSAAGSSSNSAKGSAGLPPIPNIKEFMAQLEKGKSFLETIMWQFL
jgi:MPN domain-containing protein